MNIENTGVPQANLNAAKKRAQNRKNKVKTRNNKKHKGGRKTRRNMKH